MSTKKFEEKHNATVYAQSGSKEGLVSFIKKFYYVSSEEDVRLNDDGTIERTVKGIWKMYDKAKWNVSGRTRMVYRFYFDNERKEV